MSRHSYGFWYDWGPSLVAVGIFVLVLACIVACTMLPNVLVTQETTITVDAKEYADYTYLVWDTNGVVYQVDDSLIAGRFDSSNDYYRLKMGLTYKVFLRGPRIPFLSMYPNIVQFEQVTK